MTNAKGRGPAGHARVDLINLNFGRGLDVCSHHPNFMILFVEVMEQDVAKGNNPSELLAFTDR